MVKEQLKDLSLKVNTTIQPVFACWKIEQELNVKEAKPLIVNEQCVVMQAMKVTHADVYTIMKKDINNSPPPGSISKHYKNVHKVIPQDLLKCFRVLKK